MLNVFEENEAAGQRVWFIADADSAYGRALTYEALRQDGFVVAVSDRPEQMRATFSGFDHALVCLKGDMTDPAWAAGAVDTAISCFGQIDVLINNRILDLKSRVESAGDAEVRQVFETNLFGLLNVTRCVLPYMKARGQGHVINVSAAATQEGAGLYNSARRAIDGISEALSQELGTLGVRVTIIMAGAEDAQAAVEATLQLINEARPPLRLVLGQKTYEHTLSCLENVQNEMRNWARISLSVNRAA